MKKSLFSAILMIIAGVVLFAISSGNELLTFIGFACFVPCMIMLVMSGLRKLFKKKIIWIPATAVLGILIFVLSTLLFVVFFFPNETVRKIIQEQASIALRRPVTVGYLKVSLLEGITVANLNVYDKAGSQKKFLSAKSLVLSYKLLPVLVGRLVISKAVLNEPSIQIRRFMKGKKAVTNIDDLLAPPGKKVALAAPNPAPSEKNSALPAIPMAIHISEIGLKGGAISIADSATKGFKNNYKLDKLDIVVQDFNWPATKPLKINFNLRLGMQEITASGAKGKSTFSILPGFKGSITLVPDGKSLKPTGKIDFFALDGHFQGQRLLEAGNNFLNELKRDFFKAIKKEVKKRISLFEKELKDKMSGFTSRAKQKIAALKRATIGEKGQILGSLKSKKSKSETGFSAKATKTVSAIENDINSLTKSVRKSYADITKRYPGVGKKLKLKKYLDQANRAAATMKRAMSAKVKNSEKTLKGQLNTILTGAEKAYTMYINGLEKRFAAYITKYADRIKKEFIKQIDKLEKYAAKYKMNIPFMQKKFQFNKAESFLKFKNGTLSFKNLRIGGKDFSIRADGRYGFVDSSMALKVDFKAGKKYTKHALLSLFADKEGNILVPVEIAQDSKGFRFKLMGKTIIGRMGKSSGQKANNFIKEYVAKQINIKSLSSSFRKSGTTPKGKGYVTDMDRADKKGNNSLSSIQNEYKRRVAREKKRIKEAIKKEAKKLLKKKTGGLFKKIKKKKFW